MLHNIINYLPIAHLIALLAVVLQPSTPATILDRYSTTSFFVLVILLVTWPLTWLLRKQFADYLEKLSLLPFAGKLIVFLIFAITASIWFWNFGPTTSYFIVRLYITFVLGIILVFQAEKVQLPNISYKSIIAIGILSFLSFMLLSRIYPHLLWTDEGYTASVAQTWIKTGHPQPGYWSPAIVESYSTYFGWLGIWQNIFGSTFEAIRFGMFFIAILTSALTWFGMKTAFGKKTAWQIIILGGFAFIQLNFIRRDVWAALWLSLVILCYIWAYHHSKAWPHFVVGLLAGLSLDGHPNMYRFGMALGFIYFIDYILRIQEAKKWIWYKPFYYLAAGGILAVAIYITFFLNVAPTFSKGLSSPITWGIEKVIPLLGAHITNAMHYSPILSGLAVVGMFLTWRIKEYKTLGRTLTLLLIMGAIILGLLYDRYRIHYQEHLIVPLMYLGALALWKLHKISPRSADWIFVLLFVASSAYLLGDIRNIESQNYKDALTVAREAKTIVPEDEMIIGVDPMWFEFSTNPNFREFNVAIQYQNDTGLPLEEIWAMLSPDNIIVDYGYPLPPPPEMLAYIEEQEMILVRCWNSNLGKFELWMRTPPEDVEIKPECKNID